MDHSKDRKPGSFWKGLTIICLQAVVVFAVAAYLNAFEKFSEWSRAHEKWQLDEVATMLISLTVAFGFFARRRWRELQEETIRRELAEQKLRESEESYGRIVARVADLSAAEGSNESTRRKIQRVSRARVDLIALCLLALLTFVMAAKFDAFEEFATWSAGYNHWQVNEGVTVLTIIALGLIGFSLRRTKELENEITWREEVENALRTGEERYRKIVDHATDIIYRTDLAGRFTFCNPAATNIFKYSEAELVGRHYLDLIEPKSRAEIDKFYKKQAIDQTSTTYREFPAIRKDGVQILIGQNVQLLSENGCVAGFQAVARDMTEHRRQEEILREMKEYRNLFKLANDPILIVDAVDGSVLDVNDKACEAYGVPRTEFIGRELATISSDPAGARERLQRLVAEEDTHEFETVHLRADGEAIHFVVSTSFIEYKGHKAILSINRDITERKKMEAEREQLEHQLRQSQKLESIGQLAGGIAHDFNNILTAINGYSDLALRQAEVTDSLRRNLEEIKRAGVRAAALTSQLLAFSRKQVLQPKVLDLNFIVTDMDKLLRRLIGEDIDLVMRLNPDLGQVKADPGQIEQVIMNLVVNARDAMPRGGKITVETGHEYLDNSYASRHLSVQPGNYVKLMISDTGTGMDEATRKLIFDPFFTTKEIGKGTGLGLSMVYGIVKQTGGDIWVYSEVGKGTTFKIYLPRLDRIGSVEESRPARQVPRGHETVLLVEDEVMVRNLSQAILEASGYEVLTATDGEEGLQTCKEYKGRIDLLITDVVMPRMSGRELAANLLSLRPETKILFMSGYTDDAIVRHGIIEESMPFIQKPFSPDSLAFKTRELLDQPKRPG